jgi:hypothetical protein
MMFPLVRDLAAPSALRRVPVTVTCRVLGFSTQGFYKWLASPVGQRDWDDAHLINAPLDLHGEDPEFGYRLLTDELRRSGPPRVRTGSGGCAPSSGSSAFAAADGG